MALSDELISQLVKATNDRQKDKGNTVVYGTITNDGERNYVQIDGSESKAPIETTVDINPGDRVEVSVRNHTATVTGNITNPAIGLKRFGDFESEIKQTAEEISLSVKNLADATEASFEVLPEFITAAIEAYDEETLSTKYSTITQTADEIKAQIEKYDNETLSTKYSSITQTAEDIRLKIEEYDKNTVQDGLRKFSEFQQTVEGFLLKDESGYVGIDGGSVTLTGCIKFEDFDAALNKQITAAETAAGNALTAAQGASATASSALATANNASNTASSALATANSANGTAGSALNAANDAKDIASSITIPDYIKSTYIDATTIQSPKIEGNEIQVYGTFQTRGHDGVSMITTGYMGAAQGKALYNGEEIDSYGVALARTWNENSYQVSNSYVIVTEFGVRLQYKTNSLTVSSDGIWLTANSGKAYYNGTEIGSGTGASVVAVWG